MEAKAHLKYLRISPRKVSILCDIIRGKDAKTACVYLMQTPKAASEPMLKLLKSAIANAENNNGMDVDKLVVTTAVANPAYHHRCEREGLRRLLWDRKLIPTDCALA